MIRRLYGILEANRFPAVTIQSGVFSTVGNNLERTSGNQLFGNTTLVFDNSLVISIGPENSPRTLSVRYWRRVV